MGTLELTPLKILVGLKLDRAESLLLSWNRPPAECSGRISLWISAGTPLQFRLRERARPVINRGWIEYMMQNSFGPRGVILEDEGDAAIKKP